MRNKAFKRIVVSRKRKRTGALQDAGAFHRVPKSKQRLLNGVFLRVEDLPDFGEKRVGPKRLLQELGGALNSTQPPRLVIAITRNIKHRKGRSVREKTVGKLGAVHLWRALESPHGWRKRAP